MKCPDPQQLSLDDEIQDDLSWHEWFVSLPLDPWDEPVKLPVETEHRPEERAA